MLITAWTHMTPATEVFVPGWEGVRCLGVILADTRAKDHPRWARYLIPKKMMFLIASVWAVRGFVALFFSVWKLHFMPLDTEKSWPVDLIPLGPVLAASDSPAPGHQVSCLMQIWAALTPQLLTDSWVLVLHPPSFPDDLSLPGTT